MMVIQVEKLTGITEVFFFYPEQVKQPEVKTEPQDPVQPGKVAPVKSSIVVKCPTCPFLFSKSEIGAHALKCAKKGRLGFLIAIF